MFHVGDTVVRKSEMQHKELGWVWGDEAFVVVATPITYGDQQLVLDIPEKDLPWDACNFRHATPAEASKQPNKTAADFAVAALKHMDDRASTYDAPQGERSMASTVDAFNALTGHKLTEEEGWKFMVLLKLSRSCQGNMKLDNYEDGCAYFALAGEAAAKHRG